LAGEAGGRAIVEQNLLDEVTALCEWPSGVMGSFDEAFLAVPAEVLIETMQTHQKYFPVVSLSGKLLPRFITISNIESHDDSQIRAGNERVIRPRFADAAFFWRQDLKRPLADFGRDLKMVLFQEKLGTLAEKAARLGQICRHLAGLLDMDEQLAARSAQLSKCDLLTRMIFEFPKLQGVMGRYYAEKSGEHPCVVSAMEEQYLPRHAGDDIPKTDCGLVLSVADRLDTLVGIFAIGQRPTGVKDPYGLRRSAIGLLRILIETPLPLDLEEILEFSARELRNKVDAQEAAREVFDYCMERLIGYYQDRGVGKDSVDAVLALKPSVPSDIHRRIKAVESFRALPEAEALAAANKRIRNILRKGQREERHDIDSSLLREEAEQRLRARVEKMESVVSPLLDVFDYEGALKALAGLRTDVDGFFDTVRVNVGDRELRRNRLALLEEVESMFLRVADISLLS